MATYVYSANSGDGTVSVFSGDSGGGLAPVATVPAGGMCTALAVSPDRRRLYAALRDDPPGIATFAVDPLCGKLERLGATPIDAPFAFIAADASGRFLFGASYHGNLLSVHPVDPQGLVRKKPAAVLRPGRNPHSVRADASNRFVFVPCLGSDHIRQYVFNERTGALIPNEPALATAPDASGPRHFRFGPDGRFVYVLTELSGEILAYELEPSGTLVEKRRVSFVPPGANLNPSSYVPPGEDRDPGEEPRIWGADIHMTPDGKFLYASERTGGTISCLGIDATTGAPEFIAAFATEKRPRAFAICPNGRFLVVAGEMSDHLAVHAINQENGGLETMGRYATGRAPTWVEIVDFRWDAVFPV